jgi:hypothetical protein
VGATIPRRTTYGILGMVVTVVAAYCSDYVQEEAYWIIPACIVPCSIFGVWCADVRVYLVS